jgi:predicted MFS family arabinose efflux permease
MTVPEDRDGRISARTAAILLFAFGIGIFGGYILFGSVESWIGKAAEAFIVAIAPSTIGLTIWRLEGHPLTTIATWTLPLLAATAVSI